MEQQEHETNHRNTVRMEDVEGDISETIDEMIELENEFRDETDTEAFTGTVRVPDSHPEHDCIVVRDLDDKCTVRVRSGYVKNPVSSAVVIDAEKADEMTVFESLLTDDEWDDYNISRGEKEETENGVDTTSIGISTIGGGYGITDNSNSIQFLLLTLDCGVENEIENGGTGRFQKMLVAIPENKEEYEGSDLDELIKSSGGEKWEFSALINSEVPVARSNTGFLTPVSEQDALMNYLDNHKLSTWQKSDGYSYPNIPRKMYSSIGVLCFAIMAISIFIGGFWPIIATILSISLLFGSLMFTKWYVKTFTRLYTKITQ